MKKTFFLLLLVGALISVTAQVKKPVKWQYAVKKSGTGVYEVTITAFIQNGWHTYSQTTPDGGPVPTSVKFSKNPLVTLTGTTKEVGKLEQRFEPLFGVDVKQFSNKVDFIQTVKVKGKAKTTLAATVEFMVCNDKECLPPTEEKFSIALK